MVKFTHIINPVKVSPSSDLYDAQPVTFESMRIAAKNIKQAITVEHLAAFFSEDILDLPSGFIKTPVLDRSVLDFGDFYKTRKLPLLYDILERSYLAADDADYMIYTNVDIALMPFFYDTVWHLINQGYDAFIINRRSISKNHSTAGQLPLMYAEVGKQHMGWDCFVFKRKLFPSFQLGNVCIGARYVGLVLRTNMECFASNFKEFRDMHLTFHLGEDKVWKNADYSDYNEFNRVEALKCLEGLSGQFPAVKNVISQYLIKKDPSKTKMKSFLNRLVRALAIK